MKRVFYLSLLFVALLLLDQLVKFLIFEDRFALGVYSPEYPYGGIGVFRNFLGISFSINYATNMGAAWGLFSHYRWTLFALRILMILCLCIFALFIKRDKAITIPLILVISGAVGNVIDFAYHGFVIDMFKFVLWGHEYPVFNLADTYICIGVVLWILISFVSKSKHTTEERG